MRDNRASLLIEQSEVQTRLSARMTGCTFTNRCHCINCIIHEMCLLLTAKPFNFRDRRPIDMHCQRLHPSELITPPRFSMQNCENNGAASTLVKRSENGWHRYSTKSIYISSETKVRLPVCYFLLYYNLSWQANIF